MKMKKKSDTLEYYEKWKSLSHVQLYDPMDCICQAFLSMEFSRQRGLPDPGVKLGSPTLQANSFTIWATRETP